MNIDEQYLKKADYLVFCNIEDCKVVNDIRKVILDAPKEINAIFVQSNYTVDNEKTTPKTIVN